MEAMSGALQPCYGIHELLPGGCQVCSEDGGGIRSQAGATEGEVVLFRKSAGIAHGGSPIDVAVGLGERGFRI